MKLTKITCTLLEKIWEQSIIKLVTITQKEKKTAKLINSLISLKTINFKSGKPLDIN